MSFKELVRVLKSTCPVLIALLLIGCSTSPLGRRQLTIIPQEQLNEMGQQSFQQIRNQANLSKDREKVAYVNCVAGAVAREADIGNVPESWRVELFEEDAVNAFALPGGYIGVFTGLLNVAENEDQLATVIGHEIGHVLARHANERASQQVALEQGLSAVGSASPVLMGALGVGAQYGVLMPYGRAQEREADRIGLDLMAEAGFDPRESVDLWRNMARVGGSQPEFLSTHPSPQSRIEDLQTRMPQAVQKYNQANKRPRCG